MESDPVLRIPPHPAMQRPGPNEVRRQHRRRRLTLLAASAVVAMFVGEIGFRMLLRTRPVSSDPTGNPQYVVHDEKLGWRYVPRTRARHRAADFDVQIYINTHGFRNRETSYERTPNRRRIVLLGDSLTFGWGVEAEHTFGRRLERELGADVVNLAVSGYATDQQLLLWKSEGVDYRPDLVVLTVCANDMRECLSEAVYGHVKPRFTLLKNGDLQLHDSHLPRSIFTRYSKLCRWVVGKLTGPPAYAPMPKDPVRSQALVKRLIAELDRSVRAAGAKLMVCAVRHPWLAETETRTPYLNLAPELKRAKANGESMRFAHDPHWNPQGHRVVAETLAEFIRARGLL